MEKKTCTMETTMRQITLLKHYLRCFGNKKNCGKKYPFSHLAARCSGVIPAESAKSGSSSPPDLTTASATEVWLERMDWTRRDSRLPPPPSPPTPLPGWRRAPFWIRSSTAAKLLAERARVRELRKKRVEMSIKNISCEQKREYHQQGKKEEGKQEQQQQLQQQQQQQQQLQQQQQQQQQQLK